NYVFLLIGLKYCFLFGKKLYNPIQIIKIILFVTIVNANFVLCSIRLYPELLLFCLFWMFGYYTFKKLTTPNDLLYFLTAFCVLVITRYLYPVLGVFVVYKMWIFIKDHWNEKNYRTLKKALFYSFLAFIPVLYWAKYTYLLEKD